MSILLIILFALGALLLFNILLLKFSCNKIPKKEPSQGKQFAEENK